MNKTKDFLFHIGVASLLLLTTAKQVGAQDCVLAPAGPSGQSCPPITQISVIASGAWGGGLLPPAGPWVEFAVPHSALTSYGAFIGAGGAAACAQVPTPGNAICAATVAIEMASWQGADTGQGVYATLWWDAIIPGYWTFTAVPSDNCPPWVPQLHAGGDWCNINSDCRSGMCMQPGSSCGTAICPVAECLGNSSYFNIKTANGFFLTAGNGGGIGGPNGAMNTNRTQAQAWETFSCYLTSPNQLALQTATGQWVTAVNEGGAQYGGPNADPYEIQTNRTQASCWETFQIITTDGSQCFLKTNSGNYVTAVGGGGVGNNDIQSSLPIHTNATQQGAWETFTLIPGQQFLDSTPPSPQCPNDGICCGRPDTHGQCDGVCVGASASCSGVTGYQCASNQQCCGTIDSHGNCSGQCVASNAPCP